MLRVTVKNTTKIMTMLAAANGRAARHTYTTFREIERIAERSERKLEKLDIPKKLRVGAAVTATSGLDVPNAYKWSREQMAASEAATMRAFNIRIVEGGK